VSAGPTEILETAQTIVSRQLTELRALLETAQQRHSQLRNDLRQAERAYDEARTQHKFALEHQSSALPEITAHEQQLHAACETLSRQLDAWHRALKQLDQLQRQIEMSSATLHGGGEGEPDDPWLQALRSQIIQGREEERVRLAREVHDGPAQVLANALMGLDRCRNLLREQRIEKLGLMLDRLHTAAGEGLTEVRRFIVELRPGRLAEQGLVAALRDYIDRYQQSYAARVSLEAGQLPRLATEAEIVLYRIVQEALQNAHKHARGAPVHVSLLVRHETLVLMIRDEGPGFRPQDVARRAGRESWGLTSMRERAELIGARFVVTSRLGQGTEVSLALPLNTG
jgi:two-component system, NarL family, sensor histidine kinase DegS